VVILIDLVKQIDPSQVFHLKGTIKENKKIITKSARLNKSKKKDNNNKKTQNNRLKQV